MFAGTSCDGFFARALKIVVDKVTYESNKEDRFRSAQGIEGRDSRDEAAAENQARLEAQAARVTQAEKGLRKTLGLKVEITTLGPLHSVNGTTWNDLCNTPARL